jgi:hypothetical protein
MLIARPRHPPDEIDLPRRTSTRAAATEHRLPRALVGRSLTYRLRRARPRLNRKRQLIQKLAGCNIKTAAKPEHSRQLGIRKLTPQLLQRPHRDPRGARNVLLGQFPRLSQLVDPGHEQRRDDTLLGMRPRSRGFAYRPRLSHRQLQVAHATTSCRGSQTDRSGELADRAIPTNIRAMDRSHPLIADPPSLVFRHPFGEQLGEDLVRLRLSQVQRSTDTSMGLSMPIKQRHITRKIRPHPHVSQNSQLRHSSHQPAKGMALPLHDHVVYRPTR